MNTIKTATLTILVLGAGLGAAIGGLGNGEKSLAPVPSQPELEPIELVAAQPFVVDDTFVHYWRKEQPAVAGGYLLVLRADPDLLRPRQAAEPVLYVGSQTAERCNSGAESGHLVALVPAPVDATGNVQLDPETVPIFFGSPDLPERIDAGAVAREVQKAVAAGVGPIRIANPRGALRQASTSSTLFARDRGELDLAIADLIEFYSPGEDDLVAGLRVPLSR